MITDKDRAFCNGFISHVRSYHEHEIYHVPIFNIEESEILRILEQRDASIRVDSAEQARKEAAERAVRFFDDFRICVPPNKYNMPQETLDQLRAALLGDSVVKENLITDHIPDTGEKLHPEITNDYVKKLEDDLAIAVKALEEINEMRWGDSWKVARDALKEIQK